MRLYLNEYPRTFVVTESSYALIIRHPSPTYTATESSNRHDRSKHKDTRKQRSAPELENKVIVEFLKTDMLNLSALIDITPSKMRHNKELQGFLGFLNLKGHIHLGFITRSRTVATPQRGENIHQIEEVDFYCLDSDEFDIFINRNEPELDSGLDDPNVSGNNDGISNTYPAGSVKRLLSHGNFYFLKDFDVTSSLQERGIASQLKYGDVHHAYSQRFAWNQFMSERLAEFRAALNTTEKRRFDEVGFLTVIIRGYTRTVEIALVGDENLTMTLISKQSCKRNGALFGEGGSDEDGEVPNFVETEIVVSSDKFSFSYVIVRGNVPGFWEVNTNFSKKSIVSTKLNKTIKFPRSYEAAHHAFGRHFDTLGRHFGGVHVISCLQNDEKSYKGQLSAEFTSHLNKFIEDREVAELDAKALNEATSNKAVNSNYKVTYTHMSLAYSFVKRVGYSSANPGEIVAPISEKIVEFGAMFYDFNRKTYIGKQLGVFRVNSFDSSTKANFVSKIISQEVITLAFRDIGFTPSSDLYKHHALLWEHNEESLKKLAIVPHLSELKSSKSKNFIKQHLAHKYLNAVRDSMSMEGAIQKLLGRLPNQVVVKLYNPFHQHISAELQRRSSEFKFQKDICIYAATFNVNGTLGLEDDIRRLLFPRKHAPQASYDLVFLGLQEIIELTPGKMINVKSDKFLEWEMMIKNLLEEHGKNEKYVSFWGCQMGGLAMLVFVNENQLEYISDTEGLLKKTGLGGISASKGAIAVSFNYSATSFCFICAHLAAGQGNVDDRHQNYKAIAKILFSKKKKIREHDAVIWLGDFNFRIDLPTDRVKALVEQKNYQLLLEHDQLGKQMATGETFPFFDEKEISFPPTYKFDNNTKTYDTSEKQRTPAWTDRILNLSRSNILKQGVYDSEQDIIFSDHRPVYSIFTASVSVVNEKAKKEVTQCIYENYTKAMGDINDLLAALDVSRFVYDKDNDSKPAPSSDTFKWWLEEGQLAKVSIPELDSSNHADLNRLVINPQRPANPFWESSEPEFIKRSELMQMLQAMGALRE
ncbi:DNase I-like protein [Metschnikowia bicuspidata]|uniref:phosphoinositide 5-phosphatase n=1 Tax=Metschnikowia bicuspidata TaxID=27322 RepID=A0A4P9Z8R1_9ASCO|nr:DNase I-like protein [Metschnikowia bicuspidata]